MPPLRQLDDRRAFSVYLTAADAEAVLDLARRDDRTVSAWLRCLIKTELNRNEET